MNYPVFASESINKTFNFEKHEFLKTYDKYTKYEEYVKLAHTKELDFSFETLSDILLIVDNLKKDIFFVTGKKDLINYNQIEFLQTLDSEEKKCRLLEPIALLIYRLNQPVTFNKLRVC
jgi:hypothetical protein